MGAGVGVVVLCVAGKVRGDAGIDEEGDAGGDGDGAGEEGVVAGGVHGQLDCLVGALAGVECGLEPGFVELGADSFDGGGHVFSGIVEGGCEGLAGGWKARSTTAGVAGCDGRCLCEECGAGDSREEKSCEAEATKVGQKNHISPIKAA